MLSLGQLRKKKYIISNESLIPSYYYGFFFYYYYIFFFLLIMCDGYTRLNSFHIIKKITLTTYRGLSKRKSGANECSQAAALLGCTRTVERRCLTGSVRAPYLVKAPPRPRHILTAPLPWV